MNTTQSRIPRQSSGLLYNLTEEEYGYAVNCNFPNSFRILNKKQFEIMNTINGKNDIEQLADTTNLSAENIEELLNLFSKTELIGFDENFSTPQKPDETTSLNFWIHSTNACNLGCSYCYISTLNTGKGMSDDVRNQLLYKFQEAVTQRGIKKIKLRLAGGEPLSQFRSWQSFIPLAKAILSDQDCDLDVSFITNLTILNEEIISFSKEYDITYGVSLDGVESLHDATRSFRSGRGSFDIVNKNIQLLLDSKVSVSVNTVVTNQNLAGLPALTEYLIALDVPFRYSIVRGEGIDADLLDENLSRSHTIMECAIDKGWQVSKKYQFCDLKPHETGFQTCASGFSGGAIYIDGSFKYCHVHFGDDSEKSFSIFDDKMDLIDMIGGTMHYENIKSDDCQKCRYKSVCTSGCPIYRVDGKDPQCSLYHRFIPMYYALCARERLNLLRKHGILNPV